MQSGKWLGITCIFGTIALGVYGQLVMKWQVRLAGALPTGFWEQTKFLIALMVNPWVLSGLLGAFLAMLLWMVALSMLDLTIAYPFTSLSFVLILFMSHFMFGETISGTKIAGMSLIIAGIVLASR
jgi:drug/metabolite transporter (DMT)-like permease